MLLMCLEEKMRGWPSLSESPLPEVNSIDAVYTVCTLCHTSTHTNQHTTHPLCIMTHRFVCSRKYTWLC